MTGEQALKILKKMTPTERKLKIQLFAHDQDPKFHDEGDGYLSSIEIVTNDKYETFISFQA